MHRYSLVAVTTATVAAFAVTCAAAVKNVAYPEVKVNVSEKFASDAAFQKMRQAFAAATAKKDAAGVFAFIGPTFVWTLNGGPIDRFDMGRDALHNFKVLFGFRDFGKDVDGGVENGPYWDALAVFADDPIHYQVAGAGNLVCGPIAADVVDQRVFEQARKRIETGDEGSEWYFTLAETPVAKAPGDTGPPIAKVGTVALPVLSAYPAAQPGQPAPAPTHVQVLLASGRPGWLPLAAARPLASDRLCYAKIRTGDWKIVAFDQSQ